MKSEWLGVIRRAVIVVVALAVPVAAMAQADSSAGGSKSTELPNPDPLAVGLLYQTVLNFSGDLDAIERLATQPRVDAFARCMIEHRSETKFKQTPLWEFLSKSAALIRAKGVTNSYWPPARRYRELRARSKEFDFMLAQPILGTKTRGPYNALDPTGPSRQGATADAIELEMNATGLPNYRTCMPAGQQ
jgi:hypothetical protein